jgi:hypothetical protein
MHLVALLALTAVAGCGGSDEPPECTVGGPIAIVPFSGPSVDSTYLECDGAEGHWMCSLGPSYSGLIFYGTNVYCGFEHNIQFRLLPDAPYFANIQLTLDETGAVLRADFVAGDLSNPSTVRTPESGTLAIEGGRIELEGDDCVRGRLSFMSDGVSVQGQFLTNPCWNF